MRSCTMFRTRWPKCACGQSRSHRPGRHSADLALETLEERTVLSCMLYDAAAAFSPTSNPDGVWSYGSTQALASPFTLSTDNRLVDGLNAWLSNNTGVFHNGSASTITLGGIQYRPGQLGQHPGPNGEYSVIRWTAPDSAVIAIDGRFTGLDIATTDVHVLHNGTSLFDGAVNGFGNVPSFSASLSVLAGDTIDFVVGYGSNGTVAFDSTGLTATILTDSPVPPTAVLSYDAAVAFSATSNPNAVWSYGSTQALASPFTLNSDNQPI